MSLVTTAAPPAPHPALLPAVSKPGLRSAASEYLSFRVGAEEYALDILQVQEIRGHSRPTRLAHAPQVVQGVINLRGVIVPIVDLRLCLQAAALPAADNAVVIVLDLGSRTLGVMVDAVCDVLTLDAADIRPAPPLGAALSAALLGIASLDQGGDARRTLLVLDIQQLLAQAELTI